MSFSYFSIGFFWLQRQFLYLLLESEQNKLENFPRVYLNKFFIFLHLKSVSSPINTWPIGHFIEIFILIVSYQKIYK